MAKKGAPRKETDGQAIARLLARQGPMTDAEIVANLKAAGVRMDPVFDDAAEAWVEESLMDGEEQLVFHLDDDRRAHLPSLLKDRHFTHRLTAAEVAYDMLSMFPDLATLTPLTERDEYLFLASGEPVCEIASGDAGSETDDRGIPQDDVPEYGLLLPKGFFAGAKAGAGDLVDVRPTDEGWLIEAVPRASTKPPTQKLLAYLRSVVTGREHPIGIDSVIWQACADLPTSFTELLPPIGDLLDQAGLSVSNDLVAKGGYDFAAGRAAGRSRYLREMYQLHDDEVNAVLAALDLFDLFMNEFAGLIRQGNSAPADFGGIGPFPGARETLTLLTDMVVAQTFASEVLGFEHGTAAALAVFAGSMHEVAPRQARVALRWLQARALERLGMTEEAEEAFNDAETLDPAWPLTLIDLARFASDRGDAERGLLLLQRAGAEPDDPLVEMLEQYRTPSRADIGRNDRCWCGSGRKYKQCHQHREQLPLEERTMWLYAKASLFVTEGPWRLEIIELAKARAAYWSGPQAMLDALDDGFVLDALLFEGGGFEAFLADRGRLLPADEFLLAEQWLLAPRSVYEIEEVSPGVGMLLRDLRSGDRIDISERTASTMVRRGTYICTRLMPVGDTMQIIGAVEPVDLRYRDSLIALLDDEPEAIELVEFLTQRFAPPVIRNTEGEDLVACEAVFAVSDVDALVAALNADYEPIAIDKPIEGDEEGATDGETLVWHEHLEARGQNTIRAILTLTDGELRIGTNSDERMDRVIDAVGRMSPGLVLLSDERTPTDSPFAIAGSEAGGVMGGPSGMLDPSDPAMAAIMDEYIRGYETSWLDEEIPALAGLTPRQAAADPTRRPDLIALLASFDTDEDMPGMMSAKRLRAALGLV